MENIKITKLQAQNNYYNYKLERYTHLLANGNFSPPEVSLVEKYMGTLLRAKIENQQRIDVIREVLKHD